MFFTLLFIIKTAACSEYLTMSRVTALQTMWNSLTVRGTPAQVKCYSYHTSTGVIVSGGGRNAKVHDPKPKWNAQAQQSQELDANIQLTINSFRPLFPDKICSLTLPWHFLTFSKIPDISLTAVKFPDISTLSRQVITGHPVCRYFNWAFVITNYLNRGFRHNHV